MAAKFKKGDRVRYSGKNRAFHVSSHINKIGTVTDIWAGYFPSVAFDDGTNQMGVYPDNLELVPVAEAAGTNAPKFKVGDAIRHKELNYVGTVKEVYEDGTVETFWTAEGWGARDPVEDIEPTTLTIRAGKFYRTRDGRKVGPMLVWNKDSEWPWSDHADSGSGIWRGDGSVFDRCEDDDDLIAEWVGEPSDVFDELDRWMADNPLPANDNSTAGFTVPLCALEAEPDFTAIGKAYADGYAAGLAARQAA